MENLENLVIENKKREFENCLVEVINFGDDVILTSEGVFSGE